MGCDGGTIPKRDELVRQKKKAEVKDKNAANMAIWRYCALKHETLKRPIVMDAHGLLYNKEAILEYILDRTQFERGPTYVKKMKDVKELQLAENPAFNAHHSDLGNAYLDVYSAPFVCPVTGLGMNGKYKFCALWTCGCVMSERALRAVNGSSASAAKLVCPQCGEDYSSNDDVLVLNPEGEDLQLMEQRRERLAASQKKTGSSKRKSPEAEEEKTEGKKVKVGECSSSSSARPAGSRMVSDSTASKAAKSSKTAIQEDPTTTDLYKALFTTSDAAKKKEKNKAHWVTYNPLYF